MTGYPTPAERAACRVAPLGSRSGDARWEAAQLLRRQEAALLRVVELGRGDAMCAALVAAAKEGLIDG